MKTVIVGIHEAKTHFSKLIKRVEAGDEVVVKSFDRPVAKLVPYTSAGGPRTPGLFRGQIAVQAGFDELPEGFEIFAE